jgi:two-component system nitrogen regulation sensor histidine kinase GlnL
MISPDAVVNNIDESIMIFDKKGRLAFINKTGEEFFGRQFKELRSMSLRSLFADAKDIIALIQKTIDEGRSFNCKEMEVDLGRYVNIDMNISPFYTDNRLEGAVFCVRENFSLTEREDYHFDSLLYLLGSIAHEIKNPLSGIKGAAQILQRSSNDPNSSECLSLILKETDRLNAVLQSYLTMTRRPVFNKLNIHEVLEHSLGVMGSAIYEKGIEVSKSYDPSLPTILGDESKLLQVIINIIKNAVEAMDRSKRKTLHISTRPSGEYMVIYEKDIAGKRRPQPKKQRWIIVSIEDSGAGIHKDELSRIFLPFYTKKDGGSGLGLAVSKKIVRDHGGIIKIKSRQGAGVTVNVYLPLSLTTNN